MTSKFHSARTILAALVHALMHPLATARLLREVATVTSEIVGATSNANRGYYTRKCKRAKAFKRLMSNGLVKEAQHYAV